MVSSPLGICNSSGFFPYCPSSASSTCWDHLFGDLRLEKRLRALTSSVIDHQGVTIQQLSDSVAEREAYYRLLRNKRVNISQMQLDLINRLAPSSPCSHLLLLQDSSELSYKHLKGRLSDPQGIGRMAHKDTYGYTLHPCLGLDAQSGVPVGIYDLQSWHRDEQTPDYDQREGESLPFELKSSYRWLSGALNSRQRLGKQTRMTVVSDRESDIYESMALMCAHDIDFVIRSQFNRTLANSASKLAQYIASCPEVAKLSLEVRLDSRLHEQAGTRKTTLGLRYGAVRIKRPYKAAKSGIKKYPKELSLYFVDLKEYTGDKPVHWRLLTTHPVNSIEDAQRIIHYYQMRWHIEQLFRLLKQQGLQIEDLELETGPAIIKMGVVALEAAFRILQLNVANKSEVPIPVSFLLDSQQREILKILAHPYEGKTPKSSNPYPEDDMRWATWIIARMGGWKGYRSQRPPGPITFARGWKKMQLMSEGIRRYAQK